MTLRCHAGGLATSAGCLGVLGVSIVRKTLFGLLGLSLVIGLIAGGGGLALANPDDGNSRRVPTSAAARTSDDLPSPQEDKRRALRQRALRMVLNGQRKVQTINGSRVVNVGQQPARLTKSEQARVKAGKTVKARMVDQYVELSREKTDKIFVVLAEFGNQRATDIDPRYGDQDTDPDTSGPTVFDGPLHNAIPEPDRSQDNTTVWQPNYSADYFRKLYFGTGAGVQSLKTYYEKQSSGRYSVDGAVTDWVKVKYNEARYGRSDGFPCDSNVCSNTWNLLQDAVSKWVAERKAAGRTDAQIKAELSSFDQWDRYDHDADGDFNEPDGYLDHFQIVHAGGDQADGDPYQGEDAIWSHRWYAFQDLSARPGRRGTSSAASRSATPACGSPTTRFSPRTAACPSSPTSTAMTSGYPICTTRLGIRERDAVGFWSLMAQRRLSAENDVGIGTRAGDLGAWDKLQLGWLDYEVAVAGQQRTYKMGPHEYNSRKPQGWWSCCRRRRSPTALATPYAGTKTWWSGAGDGLDNSMSRTLTLPAGPATLTFQTQYDIEDCGPDPCDYAYVEVDAGAGWTPIPGSITKAAEGNGIDGTTDGWVPATFDLSAYAGQQIGLRVHYRTDGGGPGQRSEPKPDGIFVDEIAVTAGGTDPAGGRGRDLAERLDTGRLRLGRGDPDPAVRQLLHRLATGPTSPTTVTCGPGPYNFGFAPAGLDYAEHFPYQNGLLVSYWDTSQHGQHHQRPSGSTASSCRSMPIRRPIYRLDGSPGAGRVEALRRDLRPSEG